MYECKIMHAVVESRHFILAVINSNIIIMVTLDNRVIKWWFVVE